MKKKLLSLLVAVCLIVPCIFMMTACGKDDIYGKYTMYSVTVDETTMTKADYEAITDTSNLTEDEEECYDYFEENTAFTLNEDGTFSMTYDTSPTSYVESEGTWTQDGDKIEMSFDSGTSNKINATLKDGKLTLELYGNNLVFTKA